MKINIEQDVRLDIKNHYVSDVVNKDAENDTKVSYDSDKRLVNELDPIELTLLKLEDAIFNNQLAVEDFRLRVSDLEVRIIEIRNLLCNGSTVIHTSQVDGCYATTLQDIERAANTMPNVDSLVNDLRTELDALKKDLIVNKFFMEGDTDEEEDNQSHY